MSIASEFDSTIENIKSDYEGLENLGADLTNVNKNIQNIRTCLDNIYDNLPKTTGEGSNLSLNTLKGRINVDDILGDTKQDTTNGYQLLDLTLAKLKTYNTSGTWNNNVYTISGATITINDDMSIKVNGTATEQVTLMLNGGAIPYPTGTYYLSGVSNGSNTTYDVRIFNYDGTSAVAQCFTGTKQVAVVNNSQSFNMALVVRNGVTCNNTMFYPMLSTTNTSDYEPYTNGASPNPTYPQDINVVTGEQEVLIQNRNLCDGQFRQGGWHDSSGPTRLFTTQNLVVEKGKTYTISTTLDTTRYKYGIVVGKLPYPQTTNPNIYDSGWSTTSSKTITFNVSGYDIGYLGITIATANGTDSLTPSDIEGVEWQVEYGSTATTKVEHQEQTKTLHLGDIELCKIGTYQDRISKSSGKQLFNKSDYTKGSYFNSNGELVSGANWGYAYVPCEPSTTYTASGMKNYSTPSFIEVDENKNFIANLFNKTGENSKTFTTTTGKYIGVSFVWNNSASNGGEIDTLMLNEGSTALPYEPYGSDKWYIEKNIKKRTYASNEIAQVNGLSYTNLTYFSIPKSNDSIDYNNFATSSALFDKYLIQNVVNWDSTNNIGRISNRANALTYWIGVPLGTNIETYRTQVGEIINYYILATPTYTEITNETLLNELNELDKMMSYNGQTNISVSGNLPMILDVSALKGE